MGFIFEGRERESRVRTEAENKEAVLKVDPKRITYIASPWLGYTLTVLFFKVNWLFFVALTCCQNEKIFFNEDFSHFHPLIPQLLDILYHF